MDKALPPLLVEYRDLVWHVGDYFLESCVCDCCRRMREIEAELTEALECARLVNGIREAVQEAEGQRNGE